MAALRGRFATLAALEAAIPTPATGDIAYIVPEENATPNDPVNRPHWAQWDGSEWQTTRVGFVGQFVQAGEPVWRAEGLAMEAATYSASGLLSEVQTTILNFFTANAMAVPAHLRIFEGFSGPTLVSAGFELFAPKPDAWDQDLDAKAAGVLADGAAQAWLSAKGATAAEGVWSVLVSTGFSPTTPIVYAAGITEILLASGTQANGRVGLRIPSAAVSAGATWGTGVEWSGFTRTQNTPSSVTFATPITSTNVTSVAAADINVRGFQFNMTCNAGSTATVYAGNYVTVGN